MANDLQNDELEMKRKFAAALIKTPSDPFAAAFSFISDTSLAIQVAALWPKDQFVIAERIRLMESSDVRSLLSSKEEQAKDVYTIASDPMTDKEIRLRAHRLYAEIMGHITKAEQPAVALTVGVMVVKDHGPNDVWEAKAQAQQRNLIENASSSVN